MPIHDWEIMKDSGFFSGELWSKKKNKREYFELNYFLILFHAAKYYLEKNKGNKGELISALGEMHALTEGRGNQREGFYLEGFFELYAFQKDEKTGYILIDRSYGCFPLVAYPQVVKGGARVYALSANIRLTKEWIEEDQKRIDEDDEEKALEGFNNWKEENNK